MPAAMPEVGQVFEVRYPFTGQKAGGLTGHRGVNMPTANHEVHLCRCGHGQHMHHLITAGIIGACTCCPCGMFEASRPAQEALKEGETRRRLTED